MQADPLFAPLDFAHIDGVKVGFLRQFFLAQSGLDALFPNSVAKDLQLRSWARHSFLAKQEEIKKNTPNMGVFCSILLLHICGKCSRNIKSDEKLVYVD